MRPEEIKSWGVDIGNVLLKNLSKETQLACSEGKLSPEAVVNQLHLLPDALLGLRTLVQRVGPANVWIVSKASATQTKISKMALEKFRVYQTTKLDKEQVLFCPERQDKRVVIQALELEGHIDDRGEVIESIQSIVKCPIWFSPTEDEASSWTKKMSMKVRVVSSWKQIMDILSM